MIGDPVKIERVTRYHVEIRHPGEGWTHIHPPQWETTLIERRAHWYSLVVKRDHPDAEVRVVPGTAVEVTNLRTGRVSYLRR